MAKFSVGGEDDGEGPSSPRPKRQRNSSAQYGTLILDNNATGELDDQQQQQEAHQSAEYEEEEDDEEHQPGRADYAEKIVKKNDQRGTLRPRSSNSGLEGRDGSIFFVLTDPELLDCSICCEHLSIPVFQCENGHIACSSCCIKLRNKCPSCSWPIGYNRCRAFEKVLEAIKMPCQYSRYGCKDTVNYGKKNDHEKTCIYSPCLCPLSECNFVASSKVLSLHFKVRHPNTAIKFLYDSSFSISFNTDDKFCILQEENEGVLFIVNNNVEKLGHVVTISCVGPASLKEGFLYDLLAKTEQSSLCLQSFTKNIQARVDDPPSKGFLLIPCDFFCSSRKIELDLCIWRNSASHMRIERSICA